MNKRALILLLLILPCMCLISGRQKEKKPNIIMFLVDDLGWTDVGCNGSDFYKTPNVDKLASEGMRFTAAYAACTVCSPTRASLMTGKYPARLHITDWIPGHKKSFAKLKIPDWTQHLPLEEHTIAETFREQGYATAHIGKWHLGDDEQYWPQHQGFDVNIGGFGAGSPLGRGATGYFSPYNNPELSDGPKGEYLTDRLATEACNFIDKNKESGKPFFMNFWLYSVHLPLQAKQETIEKYRKLQNKDAHQQNAIYAAMVEHMDDALGTIMKKLKDAGLDDNTIVIFYSDNGGIIGNHGARKITSNYPLRSGKGDIYEGGVRVPLIFRWPGKIKAGTVSNEQVISVDMFPTLLSLAGNTLDKSKNPVLDGVDLKPLLLANKPLKPRALYWHYPHYHQEGAKPYSAVRLGDWKLIEVFEEAEPQLYNLKDDIGESHDLHLSNPQKTKELLALLHKWRKDVGAQMPTKNPNYDAAKEDKFDAAAKGEN